MRVGWAKIGALGVTASGAVALLLTATGATGAFFSDTQTGVVTGTTGAITISTTNRTLNFTDMLPGVAQSQKLIYTDNSINPEDVYLVFPNASALGALNNLGSYGQVSVSSTGGAYFASTDLNDNSTSCGAFSSSGCNPLPAVIKLQGNLASHASGTMSFSFNYASKLTDGPNDAAENAPFNVYPVHGEVWSDVANLKSDCSTATANSYWTQVHGYRVATVTGACTGLPFQIVATQVGATPPTA